MTALIGAQDVLRNAAEPCGELSFAAVLPGGAHGLIERLLRQLLRKIGAARLGKEIAVHRLRVLPVDLFHALHPYRSPFRFVVYKCAFFPFRYKKSCAGAQDF